MTGIQYGAAQVTLGWAADDVAVNVLFEGEKLAGMNAGCLKVEAIFEDVPCAALGFSFSLSAAALRLSSDGYGEVPQ